MKASALLLKVLVLFVLLLCATTAVLAQEATAARANSYDDAWQSGWVAHARSLLATSGKTDGFVLQIGDSITHSFAYANWPLKGAGKTPQDGAAILWMRATSWGSGNADVNHKNGWYLAAADTTSQRGMTSSGGMSLQELWAGCCNGGPAMPASFVPLEAQGIVIDPAYTANLQIDTVVSAVRDAQFAVVMLGSNDPGNAQNIANLTAIVDKLEAARIVPILSTIPPQGDSVSNEWVVRFNVDVAQLAQARNLSLIDFYQEIVLRRPGTAWFGTLISTDGVHPTATGGGFDIDSDPYLPGGDPATHTSGEALTNVGYLLRSWLVVQKLKEVKQYVIDGAAPPPENTTHVGDLDGAVASASKQIWRGTVTVTLHDAAEAVVSGATMSGRWSGSYSGTGTCTTNAAGECSVSTGNINAKKGTATFTVTGVTHPVLVYRSTANHDVDGSSNGALITVIKP